MPAVPAGYIVVLDYKGYANGQLFEDTTARGKPIVFLYGKRPFSGGMCLGVEKALATMRVGEGGEGGSQGVLLLLPRSGCCRCCGPAAWLQQLLLHSALDFPRRPCTELSSLVLPSCPAGQAGKLGGAGDIRCHSRFAG